MLVKSHADQVMITNFIITPMVFLGGTFFPVDKLPFRAQQIIGLLPLTHAAEAMRTAAFRKTLPAFAYGLLAVMGSGFFVLAFHCVSRARD